MTRKKGREALTHYWISPRSRRGSRLPWSKKNTHDDLCGHETDDVDGFTRVKEGVTCPDCKRILSQPKKPKKAKAANPFTSLRTEVKDAEGKWVPAESMPPGHYVMRFVDPKAEPPKTVESPKETVREVMQSTAAARVEKFDAVEKPAHYNQGGIECIDALKVATKGLDGIEAVCTANAIKYLWRWKLKNGVEDLKKARWYIDRLIKELTPAELKKP